MALDSAASSENDRIAELLPRGERVYSKLREDISNGHLIPGERLRETVLAERFNVSRTPIREALQRLEAEGLLTHVHSKGLIVTQMSQSQVLALYNMREVLEGAAARFASQQASSLEIENIRLVVERSLRMKDFTQADSMNMEFHAAIVLAAHNEYLVKATRVIADSLLLLGGSTLVRDERIKRSRQEHVTIFEAIQRRDADEAERLARAHVRNAVSLRLEKMFG